MTESRMFHLILPVATLVALATFSQGCGDAGRGSSTPTDPHEIRRPNGWTPGDESTPGYRLVTTDDPAPDPNAKRTGPLETWECQLLLDHFIVLAQRQQAATLPPEQMPTREQVAKIRARMESDFLVACKRMNRAEYDCAMSSETGREMVECEKKYGETQPQP